MSDHIPESVKFGLSQLSVRRIPVEDIEVRPDPERTGEMTEAIGSYSTKFLRITTARPMPPQTAWATFFHELGHHAEQVGGQKLDEGVLDWFGWVLLQILVDNPGLQQRVLADLGGE